MWHCYYDKVNPLKNTKKIKNVYLFEDGSEKIVTRTFLNKLSKLPQGMVYLGVAVKWIKTIKTK